jgi:hypothetical protein
MGQAVAEALCVFLSVLLLSGAAVGVVLDFFFRMGDA